ncbi:ABC transporter [Leucothrix sargassi]|nr:ABC transporter [Leucothrix sargassi]
MRVILLIAWYELQRLFLTRRGWLTLTAFSLVWFIVLRYVIYGAAQFFSADQLGGVIASLINSRTLQNLISWQVPEIAMFWVVMLYLLPIFCVVLTADQTASDRARGTLRILHLRASRDGIFIGRFLGQLLILLLLIMMALATVLVLVMIRDASQLLPALRLSMIVLINLMLVLLPYTALMAWVSSMARSARQATTYAVIIWIVCSLLTGWLARQFPGLWIVDSVLPGSQIPSLLTLTGWNTLSLAFIPIIQAIVLLGLGRMIMQRSDW